MIWVWGGRPRPIACRRTGFVLGRTIFAYARQHTSLALYSTSSRAARPREPSSSTITAAELAAQVAAMGRRMDAEAEAREKERKEERERAERSEAMMA